MDQNDQVSQGRQPQPNGPANRADQTGRTCACGNYAGLPGDASSQGGEVMPLG